MLRVAHLHDNAGNREYEPHQTPKQRTSDAGSNDAQREIVQWDHSEEKQDSCENGTGSAQRRADNNQPFCQVKSQGQDVLIGKRNYASGRTWYTA